MAGGLYRPLSAEFGGFGTLAQHRYADCPFACERSGSHAVDVQTVLSAFFVSGTGRSCQQLRPWKGYTNLFAARDCFVGTGYFWKGDNSKASCESCLRTEQGIWTGCQDAVGSIRCQYVLHLADARFAVWDSCGYRSCLERKCECHPCHEKGRDGEWGRTGADGGYLLQYMYHRTRPERANQSGGKFTGTFTGRNSPPNTAWQTGKSTVAGKLLRGCSLTDACQPSWRA